MQLSINDYPRDDIKMFFPIFKKKLECQIGRVGIGPAMNS